MTKQQKIERFKVALLVLVGLAFLFELIRDCQRDGDFMGYVNAGNAVLNGTDIYADYLNTWPPFFSIFSVPLALLNDISPVVLRLSWLLSIIVSWFFIMKLSVEMMSSQQLTWKRSETEQEIKITEWTILLPFLFVLRFIIDDLSNIQINSMLLLACLFVVKQHLNSKWLLGGALLGFIISLKVYPIFLLLFLIYKSSYKLVLVALTTIVMTFLTTVFVFEMDTAIELYQNWFHNKAMAPTIITHKNQSFFPLSEAFFTEQTRGLNIFYNVFEFSTSFAKKLTYGIIGVMGIAVLYLFYRDDKTNKRISEFEQFAVLLAVIPIISPLAWKYYFVFLYPLYLVCFQALFVKHAEGFKYKFLFYLSLALSILSTDGLLGVRFSDVLEVYGCITIATVLLIFAFLGVKCFDKSSQY